jgi:hypothetical protein
VKRPGDDRGRVEPGDGGGMGVDRVEPHQHTIAQGACAGNRVMTRFCASRRRSSPRVRWSYSGNGIRRGSPAACVGSAAFPVVRSWSAGRGACCESARSGRCSSRPWLRTRSSFRMTASITASDASRGGNADRQCGRNGPPRKAQRAGRPDRR